MAVYPLAWIFFLLFILASTFTLLNLFIAVIVNAIQQEHGDEPKPVAESEITLLRHEIAALQKQLEACLLYTSNSSVAIMMNVPGMKICLSAG